MGCRQVKEEKLKKEQSLDKYINKINTLNKDRKLSLKDKESDAVKEGGEFQKLCSNDKIEFEGKNEIVITLEIFDKDRGDKLEQKANVNKKIFFLADNSNREETVNLKDSFNDVSKSNQENNVLPSNFNFDKLNEQNTEMYIDGVQVPFVKYYKFNEVGFHTVKYNIKKLLTKCSYMFSGCHYITEIDFSNFNSSKVTAMTLMFNKCYGLLNLNMSNMNLSNVKSMAYLLCDCNNLTTLNMGDVKLPEESVIKDALEGLKKMDKLRKLYLTERLGFVVKNEFKLGAEVEVKII